MSSYTSWEQSDKWYDQIVGTEGHYYHRQIIIPKLLDLFDFKSFSQPSLLDLACGQGVLARHIPSEVVYYGIDLSPSLIKKAQQFQGSAQKFAMADICKPLPIEKKDFTHAAIVLALQNVAHPQKALQQAATHLVEGGLLAVVLNHPCFRIPRQTSWGIDEVQKIQYRRVDRYLSPLQIPIQTHPGKGEHSQTTLSFHHSISDFSRFLANAGFVILLMEEWASDKESGGKRAKMENRARSEFPLFFTFFVQKIN
jgi:SAM-dependent methyltransferase